MLIYFLAALAPAPAAVPPTNPVAAILCPGWGTKPLGCVEPPLRERIRIYGSWRERDGSHPADAAVIRAPSLLGRWDDPVPLENFPAMLRRGETAANAHVTLRLIVAADGTVTSCTPRETKAWLTEPGAEKQSEVALGPELGAASCDLVRAHRKFRPAIDAQGRNIEAAADVVVDYSHLRRELAAPPAPPPPSRWLGTRPYGQPAAWPPNRAMIGAVHFQAPKFEKFLTDRAALPRQAVVGALMAFAGDGSPLTCAVKAPSGDARLDAATCAALMTVRNLPGRWQVHGAPIEVSWKGAKAKLRLPAPHVLPGLAAPIAIAPADVPAGELPRAQVRVRVLLDALGKPISCSVDGPSYIDAVDAATCRLALARGRFTGARDVFGRPAPGGMDLRADWTRREIYLSAY